MRNLPSWVLAVVAWLRAWGLETALLVTFALICVGATYFRPITTAIFLAFLVCLAMLHWRKAP